MFTIQWRDYGEDRSRRVAFEGTAAVPIQSEGCRSRPFIMRGQKSSYTWGGGHTEITTTAVRNIKPNRFKVSMKIN